MISCTLGIDTSCYTTSLALASEGKIVASRRRLFWNHSCCTIIYTELIYGNLASCNYISFHVF